MKRILILLAVVIACTAFINPGKAYKIISGKLFNYFVDFTSGNDANSGRSKALPKKTLSSLSALWTRGLKVGLKDGEVWNEIIPNVNNINDITFQAYSKDKFAKLTGMKAVSSFAKTDGYTYVYEFDITTFNVANAAYKLGVVEIESTTLAVSPYTSRKGMNYVASLELCDSTANSYYYTPATGNVSKIYIHPSDNSDPSSSTKTYEYCNIDKLFASTDLVNPMQNITFENIWIHPGSNSTSFNPGLQSLIKKCFFQHCFSWHQLVLASGVVDQCAFVDPSTSEDKLIVFYVNAIDSLDGEVKNSIFLDYVSGIYRHTSNDAIYIYNNFLISGCQGFGRNQTNSIGFNIGNSRNPVVNKCYTDNVFLGVSGYEKAIVRNSVFNNTIRGFNSYVSGRLSEKNFQIDNCFVKWRDECFYANGEAVYTVTNSILYNYRTLTYIGAIFYNGLLSVNITKSILIFDLPNMTQYAYLNPISIEPETNDSNVYIIASGPRYLYRYGTSGAGNYYSTLAQYQAATGKQPNSIEIDLTNKGGLTYLFIDPANGDWRMNDVPERAQILALQAGMTTPPTHYPARPTLEQIATGILSGQYEHLNDDLFQ